MEKTKSERDDSTDRGIECTSEVLYRTDPNFDYHIRKIRQDHDLPGELGELHG